MDDVVRVHVLHRTDYLGEDVGALLLRQLLVRLSLLQVMEEVRALTQLHHEVHMGPHVDHFVQSHDIRMVEHRQNVDFLVQCLGSRLVH